MPLHWTISHPQRLVIADGMLKGFAATVRRHATAGPIGPIAIVAASDDAFHQAQVFAEAATVERPIKIFREQHEARRWLNAFAEEEQRVGNKLDSVRAKRV
jgi:hypothetical protein